MVKTSQDRRLRRCGNAQLSGLGGDAEKLLKTLSPVSASTRTPLFTFFGASMVNELIPPEEMNFVGDGDFIAVGAHFLEHFVKVGGLRPHHRVLDVGSGIGRMAMPLTKYLTEGSYEGFDIVDVGVRWCQHHITPKFPKFRFQMANVFNSCYNPTGRYPAAAYRFPFPSASFDFVLVTSVFTHMMPAEMENYLAEIARVLKIGGRCLATFFLNNAQTAALMAAGKSHLSFGTKWGGGCWINDPLVPEGAVCFQENYVLEQYRRCGLEAEPVYHGAWSGREQSLTTHDVIVATKQHEIPITTRAHRASALWAHWFIHRWRRTNLRGWLKYLRHFPWRGATTCAATRARAYAAKHPELLERQRST
jgi:SAM-dependent methyltransferase